MLPRRSSEPAEDSAPLLVQIGFVMRERQGLLRRFLSNTGWWGVASIALVGGFAVWLGVEIAARSAKAAGQYVLIILLALIGGALLKGPLLGSETRFRVFAQVMWVVLVLAGLAARTGPRPWKGVGALALAAGATLFVSAYFCSMSDRRVLYLPTRRR